MKKSSRIDASSAQQFFRKSKSNLKNTSLCVRSAVDINDFWHFPAQGFVLQKAVTYSLAFLSTIVIHCVWSVSEFMQMITEGKYSFIFIYLFIFKVPVTRLQCKQRNVASCLLKRENKLGASSFRLYVFLYLFNKISERGRGQSLSVFLKFA